MNRPGRSRLHCGLLSMLLFSVQVDAKLTAADKTYNFPGGVVEIKIDKQSEDLPAVKFGLRDPVVIDHPSYWRVLIGLDLETVPGDYLVYIKHDKKDATAEHVKFSVEQRLYPMHERQSRPISEMYLNHESLSEINFENTQQPTLPLRYPTSGNWADYFGYLLTDPKSGKLVAQNMITLTTTELLPVAAPHNAIISKVDTDEQGLSTVFLDHGRGLYSVLTGLTDLSVEAGNGVVAGALIGKLPSQSSNDKLNRLTWQCILNGVYVNPIILTRL